MPQPRGTNGAAVASLVCGLALCIPFITGLAAAVLGIFGIRKSSDPRYGGRGMAIAGLLLGILSLAGWTVIASAAYYGYQRVKPGLTLTDSYVRSLAAGDVAAVRAKSTSAVSAEQIQQLSDKAKGYGEFRGFVPTGANYSFKNGNVRWEFSGRARFATGEQPATVTIVSEGGAWKVSSITLGEPTVE